MSYSKNFLSFLLAVSTVTFAMDNGQQSMRTAQENVSLSAQKLVTPELLLRKPWVRRLLVCVSMIANLCRYHESEDEYEVNHPELIQSRPTPLPASVVPIPAPVYGPTLQSMPCPARFNPASLDDASIKRYYERDRQMLEDTFADADTPQEAKNLVHMLNNQSLYMIASRLRLLYGEPGVGKSTLARTIAFKAGWHIACICGRQIRGEHRGGTSIRLQQKLEEIVAKGQNTVIIIDEMNRLFEEYNNSNFDTGDTAEDFCTFLDSQEDNRQLFIIGTMNNVDKLPPQLQDRARCSWIKLEKPKALTGTVRLFKRICTSPQCVLDPSCTDQELTQFLTPLHGQWSPRNYKLLIGRASEMARGANPLVVPVPITKAHLQAVKAKIDISDKDTNYGSKHETRDEKEERRHQQNMKMNRENFVRNTMIQKDMQANQKSSSHSWGINAIIANYSYNNSSNNTALKAESITDNLSAEEMEIYREQLLLKVHREIATVRQKIADLRILRQRLSNKVDEGSSEACLYTATINDLIIRHRQAHATFDVLQTPSVAEITIMRDALSKIDKESAELMSNIQHYIKGTWYYTFGDFLERQAFRFITPAGYLKLKAESQRI